MGVLLTQNSTFLIGSIAKLLGFIMNAIFVALSKIGIENIGLCIIIFTIITYTLMLPMTIKQQKFSRLSAVMNPEIQAINKKYQNKRDQASMLKMQEETQMVYAKYGTSPTGGCLGSLIQFPILFALWPVIRNIPAYVTGVKNAYMPLVNGILSSDSGVKAMQAIGKSKEIMMDPGKYDFTQKNIIIDALYKFQSGTWDTLTEKLPELTSTIDSVKEEVMGLNMFPTAGFGINIAETPWNMIQEGLANVSIGLIIAALLIPILSGLTQWISMKLVQKASQVRNNNNQSDDNNMMNQMNTMMNFMPLLSVFMCFTMPSGLGIYWIASAVVRTIQQVIVNKKLDSEPIEVLIEKNKDKVEKKQKKYEKVAGSMINERAHQSTKKVTSNYNGDTYKANAKQGSLAAKANMVSDFNKNNK